jgi:hypothetical protein
MARAHGAFELCVEHFGARIVLAHSALHNMRPFSENFSVNAAPASF